THIFIMRFKIYKTQYIFIHYLDRLGTRNDILEF
ncbi:hypothetical protein ECA0157_15008, partial [Escherichia coli ECA-0157]